MSKPPADRAASRSAPRSDPCATSGTRVRGPPGLTRRSACGCAPGWSRSAGAPPSPAAAAGTETTVTIGRVCRPHLPPYGPEWAWTATLAPPFAIEGHSLRAFLEHMAAEEGWTVRYASPDVAAMADRTVLHGSVEGLRTEDALDVALATSGLQYRLDGASSLVSSRIREE